MPPCVKCETASGKKAFLDNDFLPLTPGAWQKLDKFLRLHPQSLSGYTLPCLAVWDSTFHYQWFFPEPETLFLSYRFGSDVCRHLLQPIGLFSPEAQTILLTQIRMLDYPLQMAGVDSPFLERHPYFISHFEISKDSNNDNYIYRTEDLSQLSGRRYAKKRNLLAQAQRLYPWTAEPLVNGNVQSCLDILSGIRVEREGLVSGNLDLDDSAIETAVRLFADLPLHGVLIRVNGQPKAFSIFEEQTPDMAVVHFERAARNLKGLYQIINQSTANAIRECGYALINREEDLGDPGLRQSKESYFPAKMGKAFRLTLRS